MLCLPDVHAQNALPGSLDVQTSGSLAYSGRSRLVVVNPLSDTVSFLSLPAGTLDAVFAVGDDPRSVTLVPGGRRALVVSRGANTLHIFDYFEPEAIAQIELGAGSQPQAVVADRQRAYIALRGADAIAVVDLNAGAIIARIATPPDPAGLALWGDQLYVAHLHTGTVSVLDLKGLNLLRTFSTGSQTGLTLTIDIDPREGVAYLPQTLFNAARPSTLDNRAVPIVSRLDLRSGTITERVLLPIADRHVNAPAVTRYDPFRRLLYVLHAGSDDLSVIDTRRGLAVAHLSLGANPRGMVFNQDRTRLYVHNALDESISVIETRYFSLADTLPTRLDSLPPVERRGAQLFHSSATPHLSANRALSCMTCHFDGESDGRVWQGATTPTLNGPTPQADWLNAHIEAMQGGTGLAELDLDALLRYLARDD